MTALRVAIAALALAALAAVLLVPAPGSFAIAGPAAILILLIAFGSTAADALPFRGVPFACSALTAPLAVALMLRPAPAWLVALAILALQALAWRASSTRG